MGWYTNYEFTVHGVELTNDIVVAFNIKGFSVSSLGQLIVLDIEIKYGGYSEMHNLFDVIETIAPAFTKINCVIKAGNYLGGDECRTFCMERGSKAVPTELPVKRRVYPREESNE